MKVFTCIKCGLSEAVLKTGGKIFKAKAATHTEAIYQVMSMAF